MTLETTIQAAAKTAQTTTLSLWRDITYNSIDPSSYNASTGAVTSSTTATSLKAIIGEFKANQIDGDLFRQSDVKVTILLDDLTTVPQLTDTIIYGSNTYNVISHSIDIAKSMYRVQCRD
jgi:hypothetical protein